MERLFVQKLPCLLMMTVFLSSNGLAGWTVLSGATAPLQLPMVPARAGEIGRGLSDQDIAALRQTLPAGAVPWLLIGERGQSSSQYVEAYLAPVVATPQVRRGPMIPLRRLVRSPAPPESWTIVDNYNGAGNKPTYAQVVIAGRPFAEIQGDEDLNRPFLINGSFDDTDLMAIVAILRADNGRTVYPGGGYVKGLPILRMTRQSDTSVVVDLRDGGILRQQRVTLDKREGSWIIVKVITGRA